MSQPALLEDAVVTASDKPTPKTKPHPAGTNVVAAEFSQDQEPKVAEQIGNRLEVTHSGSTPIGTFLRIGDAIGSVRSHQKHVTLVDLLFQWNPGPPDKPEKGKWDVPRRGIRKGTPVRVMDSADWVELMRNLYPKRTAVGELRQEGIACPAYIPPLQHVRGVVIAASGAGKSTFLNSMISRWRNAVHAARRKPGFKEKVPGVLVIDPHGDFCGNVRDEDDVLRPSLVRCMVEDVLVAGAGDFTCCMEDIPVPVLVRCLGSLSPAQRRFCENYLQAEASHANITALLGPEKEWPGHFPELASYSVEYDENLITKANGETLSNLRARFRALIDEPLFTTGKSSWQAVMARLYRGECVIIDTKSFEKPKQRSLVVILLMQMLKKYQNRSLSRNEPCHPIVFVTDEFHQFEEARDEAEEFFLDTRKLNIGTLLASQQITHFPKAVIDNATNKVFLRVEADNRNRILRDFSALKPYAQELTRLEPGEGFVLGKEGVPWPFRVLEAPILEQRRG